MSISSQNDAGVRMVCDLLVEAVESRFDDALPDPRIEWLTDNDSPCVVRDTRVFVQQINLLPRTTAIKQSAIQRHGRELRKTFRRHYVGQMDHTDALAVMRQLPAR